MLKTAIIITVILWSCFLVAHAEEKPAGEKQTFTEGNDTYNFYFQKAPGPTVVNQGVAPSVIAPAPTSAAEVKEAPISAPSPARDFPAWQLSLGIAAPIAKNLSNDNSPTERTVLSNQFAFGLQVNSSSLFGITGEYFSRNPAKRSDSTYKYWDEISANMKFALGVAVTPLRSSFGSGFGASLSALGGFASVKRAYGDYRGGNKTNAGYYGLRGSVQFPHRLALDLTARRVTKLNGLQGMFSLAYLF